MFRESPFIEIVELPDKNIKVPLVDDFSGSKSEIPVTWKSRSLGV